MSYLVVEFTEEQTSAVVPDIWVRGSCCHWPPSGKYSEAKLAKLVLKSAAPESHWDLHHVRVLGRFGMLYFLVLGLISESVTSNWHGKRTIY